MIQRFHVNNYRCLLNFNLPIAGLSSVLLIGKNGAGKTTVRHALEILQKIGRGTNRVRHLVTPQDFCLFGKEGPMRLEIEVKISARVFAYEIAFDFPPLFKEMRIVEEKLQVDSTPVYTRELAQVEVHKDARNDAASFRLDWHLAALPIIQDRGKEDPLNIFKLWLSRLLILNPIPQLITGESEESTLLPQPDLSDFGAWFTGLLKLTPAAYTTVDGYLKDVMPDFEDVQNQAIGSENHQLLVQFASQTGKMQIPLEALSDGEKGMLTCALVLGANRHAGPVVCFWDEPDGHLALDEVAAFIMGLRKAYQGQGQFIATSHNPRAIDTFSDENTLLLYRKSHLEPTNVRSIADLRAGGQIIGNLADAMIRGDLIAHEQK